MPNLSININKFATLRNARGGNLPNLVQVALDCQRFGAEGITIHPRPDERHITRQDVYDLKQVITTEFNIEGNPNPRYMDLIRTVLPTQATLVPDGEDVLTSNAGWNTVKHAAFLKDIIRELKDLNIRTSIFIDPIPEMIEAAAQIGTERIELYTEAYAKHFSKNKVEALKPYKTAARLAHELDLGVNAGHDLNLINLNYLKTELPNLLEVSIGHALICDSLYYGLQNTIGMYLKALDRFKR